VMFIILVLIVAVARSISFDAGDGGQPTNAPTCHPAHAGAAPGRIMQIFIIQARVIGAVGMIAGVVGGVLLAANIES